VHHQGLKSLSDRDNPSVLTVPMDTGTHACTHINARMERERQRDSEGEREREGEGAQSLYVGSN